MLRGNRVIVLYKQRDKVLYHIHEADQDINSSLPLSRDVLESSMGRVTVAPRKDGFRLLQIMAENEDSIVRGKRFMIGRDHKRPVP